MTPYVGSAATYKCIHEGNVTDNGAVLSVDCVEKTDEDGNKVVDYDFPLGWEGKKYQCRPGQRCNNKPAPPNATGDSLTDGAF